MEVESREGCHGKEAMGIFAGGGEGEGGEGGEGGGIFI